MTMKTTAMFALVGAVLAITIGMSAAGLQCYEGTGTLNALVVKDNCTSCQKTTASVSGVSGSASACLSTSCTASSSSVLGVSAATYCCSTNLCNTAATQTVSVFGLVIASLAVLLRTLQ